MLRRAASNLVEGLLLAMMVVLCADVFLGVAVVAAGVATVLFFTRPTVEVER